MQPVDSPRSVCYSSPRDMPENRMHYIVVRVSKNRYMVAEWSSHTMNVATFDTVSEPLRYVDAINRANELTRKRTDPADNSN